MHPAQHAPAACRVLAFVVAVAAGCGGRVMETNDRVDSGRALDERSSGILAAVSTAVIDGSVDGGADGATGTIYAEVQFPAGTVLSAYDFELSGAEDVRRSSTGPGGVDGGSVSFSIARVPVARGYTLSLTASAVDGRTCSSTALFNVAASQPTLVVLIASCS